jgi:ribosomal RNA assembly protein
MQYLKIPKERIPVLIGEKGAVKRDIEKRTRTKIDIEDTSVSIGTSQENYMEELVAANIVLSIGRGFNPETAMMLMQDDYTLEVLSLRDFANTASSADRIKGRIIGANGKARKNLEELTGTYISVYGKTISVIGSYDDVAVSKEAVTMLISGARHASVYRFLEKKKAQRRYEPPEAKSPQI